MPTGLPRGFLVGVPKLSQPGPSAVRGGFGKVGEPSRREPLEAEAHLGERPIAQGSGTLVSDLDELAKGPLERPVEGLVGIVGRPSVGFNRALTTRLVHDRAVDLLPFPPRPERYDRPLEVAPKPHHVRVLFDLDVEEDPLQQLEPPLHRELPVPSEGGADPAKDPVVREQGGSLELPRSGTLSRDAGLEIPLGLEDGSVELLETSFELTNESLPLPRVQAGRHGERGHIRPTRTVRYTSTDYSREWGTGLTPRSAESRTRAPGRFLNLPAPVSGGPRCLRRCRSSP